MFSRLQSRLLIAFISFFWTIGVNLAFAYDPPRASLLIDVEAGKTLHAHNADKLRHPASLTKMMTLYMVFEALEAGKIEMGTPVTGSRHSADRPPSRLGLAKGESISVDLAIDALVVRSANDVAAALGELLAGSEENFASLMTQKAKQLGMKNTVYKNASGLPDSDQVTTAYDQAILGLALKQHFPGYFPRFSVPSVSYKDRTWNTHNKLLNKVPTITGIKTGFINASGFNVVSYDEAIEGETLVVVMGGRNARERDDVVVALLEGKTPAHLPGSGRPYKALKNIAAPKPNPVQIPAANLAIASAAPTKSKKPTQPLPLPTEAANEVKQVEVDTITTASVSSVAGAAANAASAKENIKRYAIQVGVLPTVEGARARLNQARPALKDDDNRLRQFALPLETSSGKTHYRARIIGFQSMGHAFAACEVMEAAKIECMALVQK